MHTKTKPANRKPTKRQQAKKTRPQQKRTTAPPADSNTLSGDVAKPLVTADVVSQFTGIPRGTVYVMARRKMIPCYKTGANRYALRFAIAEVLAALRVPVTATAVSSGGDEAKG